MNSSPSSIGLKCSRRPSASEHVVGIQHYLDQVLGDDAFVVLRQQLEQICELSGLLSADRVDRIDPPFNWTIRQVLEHCLIGERVFGYRILRIASGDTTPLPGFDENLYANARFGLGGGIASMMSELGHLRYSLLLMLARIEPAAWDRIGQVDGKPISMRAATWLAAGHLEHHFRIVRNRVGA